MTIGSLFSGIGGLDLGLERAGHTVRWQVEANPYCRRILAQHWPDIPCYPDVTHLTAETLEPVDLICGGFPCQPVSTAGAQKGTDDDRWLWPHFARLLGALRPRYALLENVPGLLTTHGGREFGAILSDLADSGYDAEWDCLPASAVGAPHRRYRVFIIASLPDADADRTTSIWASCPDADRLRPRQDAQQREELDRPHTPRDRRARHHALAHAQEFDQRGRSGDSSGTLADADRTGPQGRELLPQRAGERAFGAGGLAGADHQRCVWGRQPEQRGEQRPRGHEPDGRLSDGRFFDAPISGEWLPEPDVGRVAHGVPHRVDRLKALGNAVVPQMAEWLGERLTAHAEDTHADSRQG